MKAISGLLRREFRFLHKPLNIWSRLLLLAAAVTIGVSLFFPLWKMHLVAPQYSDGLDLYIFPYKIQGGGLNGQHLNEINNLNHYIGMKPLQAADFLAWEINRRLQEERVMSIAVDEIEYVAVGEGDLVIKDATRRLEKAGANVSELLKTLEQLTESAVDPSVGAEARPALFHSGTSARGPICIQPTALPSSKASSPGGGPASILALIMSLLRT
jgi:hypothetical protein